MALYYSTLAMIRDFCSIYPHNLLCRYSGFALAAWLVGAGSEADDYYVYAR